MGLFSSKNNSDSFTGKEYNTLKAALDEGLQHAYQFGSDQQNIEDALNCLSAKISIGLSYLMHSAD